MGNNYFDNSSPAEMRPYSSPPRMGAGSHGKHGILRLHFELDDKRRSILRRIERQTPLIVQQELYFDEMMPQMPCVYILSSGGPNVDGDRYEQLFSLDEGAFAHIATGAATKLASMRHNYSAMRQEFRLAADSYLEYLPEPVIPCRNARYISLTEIDIAPTASLIYGEMILCGRKHSRELFEYDMLRSTISARGPSGKLLFSETSLSRSNPTRLGQMGGYDVRATAYILCPKEMSRTIYTSFNPTQNTDLATGLTLLPDDCGLKFVALGHESGPVKRAVRELCSLARLHIKGRALPNEFAWR